MRRLLSLNQKVASVAINCFPYFMINLSFTVLPTPALGKVKRKMKIRGEKEFVKQLTIGRHGEFCLRAANSGWLIYDRPYRIQSHKSQESGTTYFFLTNKCVHLLTKTIIFAVFSSDSIHSLFILGFYSQLISGTLQSTYYS